MEHVGIPEPKDLEPLRPKPLIPRPIPASVRGIGMLPAVEFNDNARLVGNEVDDIWSDGFLTPELHSRDPMCAKVIPQPPFRIGRAPPKRSGEVSSLCHSKMISHHGVLHVPTPTLALPHQGGKDFHAGLHQRIQREDGRRSSSPTRGRETIQLTNASFAPAKLAPASSHRTVEAGLASCLEVSDRRGRH